MNFERHLEPKKAMGIGLAKKIKNAELFISINYGTDLCKPQNKHLVHLAELYFEINTGIKCKIQVVDHEHIKIKIGDEL